MLQIRMHVHSIHCTRISMHSPLHLPIQTNKHKKTKLKPTLMAKVKKRKEKTTDTQLNLFSALRGDVSVYIVVQVPCLVSGFLVSSAAFSSISLKGISKLNFF